MVLDKIKILLIYIFVNIHKRLFHHNSKLLEILEIDVIEQIAMIIKILGKSALL
jgi:hypothetical protein